MQIEKDFQHVQKLFENLLKHNLIAAQSGLTKLQNGQDYTLSIDLNYITTKYGIMVDEMAYFVDNKKKFGFEELSYNKFQNIVVGFKSIVSSLPAPVDNTSFDDLLDSYGVEFVAIFEQLFKEYYKQNDMLLNFASKRTFLNTNMEQYFLDVGKRIENDELFTLSNSAFLSDVGFLFLSYVKEAAQAYMNDYIDEEDSNVIKNIMMNDYASPIQLNFTLFYNKKTNNLDVRYDFISAFDKTFNKYLYNILNKKIIKTVLLSHFIKHNFEQMVLKANFNKNGEKSDYQNTITQIQDLLNKIRNVQYEIPSLKIEHGDEISLEYIQNDIFNMGIKYSVLENMLKTLSLEDYKFIHEKWVMQFAYDIIYNNIVNFNPNNKKLIQKYDICNHLLFTEIYDNFYEIMEQVEDTLTQIAPLLSDENEDEDDMFDDIDDKLFKPKLIDINKKFSMSKEAMTEEEQLQLLSTLDTDDVKKIN